MRRRRPIRPCDRSRSRVTLACICMDFEIRPRLVDGRGPGVVVVSGVGVADGVVSALAWSLALAETPAESPGPGAAVFSAGVRLKAMMTAAVPATRSRAIPPKTSAAGCFSSCRQPDGGGGGGEGGGADVVGRGRVESPAVCRGGVGPRGIDRSPPPRGDLDHSSSGGFGTGMETSP